MKQKGASVPPNIAMVESTPIHMNTGEDKDPVPLAELAKAINVILDLSENEIKKPTPSRKVFARRLKG